MFKNRDESRHDLLRRVAALEGIYESQRQHIKDLNYQIDTLVRIIDNLIACNGKD